MRRGLDLRHMLVRWVKFNAVGGIGMGVQLGALLVLKGGLHLNYMAATAVAVETAILHNFFWHVRFTWRDRPLRGSMGRFLKFQTTTGLFSIAGNLLLMKVLVATIGVNYLLADCTAIAACSLLNFAASERFVFRLELPTNPTVCEENLRKIIT